MGAPSRLTLVFPPLASPTYVPLGIASLAAYVRQQVPACTVRLVDLNLSLWERVAGATPQGAAYLRFCRGTSGHFFDEQAYRQQQRVREGLESSLTRLSRRLYQGLGSGAAIGPEAELGGLIAALAEEITADDPDLVGVSLFSFAQLPWAVALAQHLHGTAGEGVSAPRRRGPRILFGGAACAALHVPDLLQACPALQGVVVGEGERALAALCRGEPSAAIPGLSFRDGQSLRRNRPPDSLSLQHLPAPDFDGLDMDRPLNPLPVLPVTLTRSCKWRRCRFCAHNASFAAYRKKSAEALVDELELYGRRYGARHFYFADLYVEPSDLELVADTVLERHLDVRYHVLGRPIADDTPQRLAKLFDSGCRWISWGVESGSQRLLDLVAKGTRVDVVERVLRDAHAAGLSNLAMMIYGLPTSTSADLQSTFVLLERIYEVVDAMTASAFALFETSVFGRRARDYGLTVLGRQVELRVGSRPVHSLRLSFSEQAEDGSLRPPCGPQEIDEWQRHRAWLGEPSLLEGLPVEHYLLYVAERSSADRRTPIRPMPRAA